MVNFQEFPQDVCDKLGCYVYSLDDPNDKKPFYIGRGTGNRVFQHLREAEMKETKAGNFRNDKLDKIREIWNRGQDVDIQIHRYGLEEKEAKEVEATLIEFMSLYRLMIVNRVSGIAPERGNQTEKGMITQTDAPEARLRRRNASMQDPIADEETDILFEPERSNKTPKEVIAELGAPAIDIAEPSILIRVNQQYYQGISKDELYDITRQYWVLNPKKHKIKYAFAVYHGIVRQVYEIVRWIPDPDSNRWIFEGPVAESMQHYIGGSVSRYVKYGAQNPIKYVNC